MGINTRGPDRLLGTAVLRLADILNAESFVSTPEASEGTGYNCSFGQWGADCTLEDDLMTGTPEPNFSSLTPRLVGAAREFRATVWHGGVQCGQLHGRAVACPATSMDSVPINTFWAGAARQGRVSYRRDSPKSPGSGGSGRGSCDSDEKNISRRTNSFVRLVLHKYLISVALNLVVLPASAAIMCVCHSFPGLLSCYNFH
jgi:hypothetical protein